MDYLKLRSQTMNEFHCDHKKHIAEYDEVAQLNEDLFADNSYSSKMNLDNFPTHEHNGESYCAASKYYKLVDPACPDHRSLHYAGEDRVYLIFKNKFTQEWEFPASNMFFGQTFLRARQDLFNKYSDKKWLVKFYGTLPMIHTMREFSDLEKEDPANEGLKGVRTYFFGAHHFRGLPEMNFGETEHEDWAWVPKRQLNEYLTKEYYEVFIHSFKTR